MGVGYFPTTQSGFRMQPSSGDPFADFLQPIAGKEPARGYLRTGYACCAVRARVPRTFWRSSVNYLYRVKVGPGLVYDALGDAELHLKKCDEVVVKCERYEDAGCIRECHTDGPVDEKELQKKRAANAKGRHVEGRRVPRILRRASSMDRSRLHENETRAKTMHRIATDRIGLHELDMRLINTHYSLDRRLVVFQFTAEGRIDFRELLRDLSREFRTRVELRQIGVRDEAAIQGGLGPCGRVFCCTSFLREFSSINVKMAKAQGLSLNPSNISGVCGRLKCCLRYEVDLYRERQAGAGDQRPRRNRSASDGPDGREGSAGQGPPPDTRRSEANREERGARTAAPGERSAERGRQRGARTAAPGERSAERGRQGGGRNREGDPQRGRPRARRGGRPARNVEQ